MINNKADPRGQPQIAIFHMLEACYPHQPPFHPSIAYPEYRGPCSDENNQAYAGVREVLYLLGLDASHFGMSEWNPLGELIQPGNHVLIKPNLIRAPYEGETAWECVVTHASVIRAVLDYVAIALQGNGQVTVSDGPDTEQNFDIICQRSGLYEVLEFFRKNKPLRIDLVDIRNEHWVDQDGMIIQRTKAQGDPSGSVTVDLGYQSCFDNLSPKRRFYGADYDITETNRSHSNGHHIYSFSRSALSADVVINLPKMKTHKKTGITLCLKNLVGLNTHRNYLPHYTMGFPKQGGDQYEAWSIKRQFEAIILNTIKPFLLHAPTWVLELFGVVKNSSEVFFQSTSKVVRSGNWYGNDTTWRMVLDLNKLFFYYDQNGRQREKPPKYLNIVDGLIAGHKNGPMSPEPLAAGIIAGGFNPVALDTACATIMGFEFKKIPLLAKAWKIAHYPLAAFSVSDIVCWSNVVGWSGSLVDIEQGPHLHFEPHFGWIGHIER